MAYQVKNDKKNSRQVKIWKNFCKDKCQIFINSHETFFLSTLIMKKNYSDEEIIFYKFYIK